MLDFTLAHAPPEPRPPSELPQPDPSPIPDNEDPGRPSIPEELPQPTPDPQPSDNPPVTMQAVSDTKEMNGRPKSHSNGLEETRFGDWELNGKCVDF